MSRRRKGPWKRGGKGSWYTTIGRNAIRVADAEDSYNEAFKKMAEVVAATEVMRPELITVKNLFRNFLQWSKANRSEATFKFYERYLLAFEALHGSKRVAALLPRHVESWIEAKYSHCSSTTRNDIMKAVNRAINWGLQKRLLKHNPLIGMEKPPREARETVLTPSQYRKMLSYVTDAEFRDYLVFLWNTGCRAMEIRLLEKRHFDGMTLTLPASEAKGKKHPRVIYLNDVALPMIQRLIKEYPMGPLFRTAKGKEWKANTVRCRFRLLKKKMGVPGLCATTMRHSWATNALKSGMDSTTASILMGHRDPATLIRNYQHLVKDQAYLLGALNSLPSAGTQPVVAG